MKIQTQTRHHIELTQAEVYDILIAHLKQQGCISTESKIITHTIFESIILETEILVDIFDGDNDVDHLDMSESRQYITTESTPIMPIKGGVKLEDKKKSEAKRLINIWDYEEQTQAKTLESSMSSHTITPNLFADD